MKIYLAGPYSKGDQAMNVRNMIVAQDYIESALGHMAYNPLLSHFQHLVIPHVDVNYWYEKDLAWLRECDAVLRLLGESTGADKEVALAQELGMPVYYSIEDIPKQ
jgi:nucleoside 2-deoxyribosyltransferase